MKQIKIDYDLYLAEKYQESFEGYEKCFKDLTYYILSRSNDDNFLNELDFLSSYIWESDLPEFEKVLTFIANKVRKEKGGKK